MNNRFKTVFVLLLTLSLKATGQNLTATTNDIHFNFAEGIKNTSHLPEVQWLHPAIAHTVTEESDVVIEAEIISFHQVDELTLGVIDALTKVQYGQKKLEVPGNKSFRIKEKIHLPQGRVDIVLTIKNAEGVTVSSSREILVGQNLITKAVLLDRKDYALIFATDKYDHWDDLVNPVHDAHSIATELEQRYGFETEIVENPTVEEVWEKIRQYNERKFKPQDQLFIFFAGHGHFDDTFGEGYVVARNSLANDKSKTTYISHNRLRAIVNNIPCEHIFLAMDVCFGGTFDPVLAKSRSAMAFEATNEELIVRKLGSKTRKYLTSGGKEYVSDGIPGSHSPFAAKLIESFKTNGGDDRILTIAELRANLEKLKQLPRFGSFGDDESTSDFIFIHKMQ